jgi:predicted acyltransferase (DUF342 family)
MGGKLFTIGDVSFGSRLFANGDASLNGNVIIGKDLLVNGNLSVKQYSTNLTVYTVSYEFIVAQDMSVNGRLFTVNDVSMGKNAYVAANLIAGNIYSSGTVNLSGTNSISGYLPTSTASSTYAPLASPALTGTPTAPNATTGTNTTQLATTAFVQSAITTVNSSITSLNYFANDVSMNSRLFLTSDLSMSGRLFVNNDSSFNGNITINKNTACISTTTGALVVSGGVGISGNCVGGSFITTSDYRIKTDIMELDNTYMVDPLRPVQYYNKNTNGRDIGFIAHEVQQIYPFLVTGEKDGNDNQSLNYNGIIGILVKEVKELKREVKELKQQLQEKL